MPEGSVQHLIARCVNTDFLLDTRGARAHLLGKLGEKLHRHDCRLLAYSVMSSHLHLAALIGKLPLDRVLQGLLCSVAMRINLVRDRIGHAFANRFTNKLVPRDCTGYLVAYIHNNEQRANIVDSPQASRWSSHRAYVGLAPQPDWLDVKLGLELSGFEDTAEGRRQFHEFVVSRSGDPRQPQLSMPEEELAALDHWVVRPHHAIELACDLFDLRPELLSSGTRAEPAPFVRAATLLAWCDGLGRRAAELLPLLGISAAAASHAMSRARAEGRVLVMAETILEHVVAARPAG